MVPFLLEFYSDAIGYSLVKAAKMSRIFDNRAQAFRMHVFGPMPISILKRFRYI